MILVTVGNQLPFDRLVGEMDRIAADLPHRVVAQTGRNAGVFANLETHVSLPAEEFERLAGQARIIVSHAGIGSVLLARRLGKPIVVIPRLFALGEHRNDHQRATAARLRGVNGVVVAENENALKSAVLSALDMTHQPVSESPNIKRLRGAVATFIDTGTIPHQP